MEVRILSDLHLGKGRANDFRMPDGAFAQTLRDLAAGCDWLILNGDIFEMWEPVPPAFPQTKELFDVLCEAYPETVDAISSTKNIVALSGNHDSSVYLGGWLPKMRTEVLVPELSLFVAHGHQGDRMWCSESSPCLCCVSCMAAGVGYGEILIDENFDEAISRVRDLANKKTDGEIADYAFAVAEHLNTRVVCFGHTHHAAVEQRGRNIYVNCGMSKRHVEYASIRRVEDRIEVDLRTTETGPEGEFSVAGVSGTAPLGVASSVGSFEVTWPESMAVSRSSSTTASSPHPEKLKACQPPRGTAATHCSKGALLLAGTSVLSRPNSFLAE